MAFEVTCGQCNGRLRVEQPGTVVACPHCGTHLTTADAGAVPATDSAGGPFAPADSQSGVSPEADAIASTLLSPPAADVPSSPAASSNNAGADQPDFSGFEPGPVAAGDGATGFPQPPFAAGFPPSDPVPPAPVPVPDLSGPAAIQDDNRSDSTPPDQSPPVTTTSPDISETDSSAASQVQSKAFTLLKSYAILVTVLAGWLFLQTRVKTSELESLPDVEPKRGKDGKIGFIHTREDASVPAGHTLKLGEERRFGNLKVEALRVTRGTLEFDHFDADSKETRAPVSGVLKLWLRFTNVSEDQNIAPLRNLAFKRHYDMETDRARANNFVCRTSQKKPDGNLTLVYEHVIDGNWNIRGMNFHDPILPGQSIETFIPTTAESEESLFADNEPLVWRFHFRKGYSPKGYGVTTLVEVQFSQEEVAAESAETPAPETIDPAKQS